VPVDGPSQVIGFLQGIKWDDFQGMKAGIMTNPNTASHLGLAIKAMKKQVKIFFPTINTPGRVYAPRGNAQQRNNSMNHCSNGRHHQEQDNSRGSHNHGKKTVVLDIVREAGITTKTSDTMMDWLFQSAFSIHSPQNNELFFIKDTTL
jgi:hypothetical protein